MAATSVLLMIALATVWALVPSTHGQVRPSLGASTSGLPSGFAHLVMARFLFTLGTFVIGRFLLLLVADRLGIDAAHAADETGTFMALFTLIGAIAAVGSGVIVDRVGPRRVMRLGIMASAVGVVGFLPSAGSGGVLIAGTTMALGTAAFASANWAASTRLVPAAQAGRLMGLANLGTGGAAACAGLIGPLIDWGGFTPAILVALSATLAALVPLATSRSLAIVEPHVKGVAG
jgi:MFS family permease